MTDLAQFVRLVIRPTLSALDLYSTAAERLLVGTAAHESAGLRYLRQVAPGGVDGVARGPYQIEPATRADLERNYLAFRPKLAARLMQFEAPRPTLDEQLAANWFYATAVARLIYFRVPAALPDAEDLDGLAHYWKAHWNTPAGAGTPAKFLADWHRYAAPVYAGGL